MNVLTFPGPAPARVLLIPAGAFRMTGKSGSMRLREPEAVTAEALSRLPLVIDENYAISRGQSYGRGAMAMGWITGLEVAEGAIWAAVAWTRAGRALLEDRAYRFVSPALAADDAGSITRLLGATLTNVPELVGALAIDAMRSPLSLHATRPSPPSPIEIQRIVAHALRVQEDAKRQGLAMTFSAAVRRVLLDEGHHHG